jgi:hypothetical protein
MKSIYKNNGKRWSDEEDTQLLQELIEKVDFEIISTTHNRSISAIKSRIYMKAENDYRNGVEEEVIFTRYNMNEEMLNDALAYVQKMENKKDKVKSEKKEVLEDVQKEEIQVTKPKKEGKKGEEIDNTILLKELLHEVREMNSIMKEFIFSFQQKKDE